MDDFSKLAKLFLEGNEDDAIHYLSQMGTTPNRLHLYEQFLTPTMYHIGDLWERNEISVADEHLATAVCDFVLSQLDSMKKRASEQNASKVLLFGIEEEQHYLGLKMVASTFREYGWNVRYLGPNLPLDHALKQVNRYKPDVVGVSAALSYRLPVLKEVIEHLTRLEWSPTVLIGGRMAKEYDLSSFASERVVVMKDLHQLETWIEGNEEDINATS